MSREVINPLDTEWYRCSKCERSFFVKSEDSHRHLLKKSMRCPNYVRCKGRVFHKSWSNAGEIKNWRWISALELYQASAGLGLASERNCSPDALHQLLHGSRIATSEILETGDPQKSILLSLTLENKKTIHLASSTKGAIIYKVTTEKV
jgi:DNA-directed RNA polymerase subunit RPC12/RpoP